MRSRNIKVDFGLKVALKFWVPHNHKYLRQTSITKKSQISSGTLWNFYLSELYAQRQKNTILCFRLRFS